MTQAIRPLAPSGIPASARGSRSLGVIGADSPRAVDLTAGRRSRGLPVVHGDANEPPAQWDSAVRESWARCRLLRLQRDALCQPAMGTGATEGPVSPVLKLVDAFIEQRRVELERSASSLCFTDAEGVVLAQWSGTEAFDAELRERGIRPGASIAEDVIGTSSAITLHSREPVLVWGEEHYAARLCGMTSAGLAIAHPITKRLIGSLNLWCSSDCASPLALSWVGELVHSIEGSLAQVDASADRFILERYLQETRDSRHPLVVLNEDTIVTNAAAARVLAPSDQALLWEHASRLVRGEDSAVPDVDISGGRTARVECTFVTVGGKNVGVAMRLKKIRPARTAGRDEQVSLPGLVGASPRWQAMRRSLTAAGRASVLLVGDCGTGKSSIARSLAPSDDMVEIDVSSYSATENASWLSDLERSVESEPSVLVLLHLDELPLQAVERVATTLERCSTATRLVGTCRTGRDHSPRIVEELSHLAVVVEVPALRERPEDIPELVRALGLRNQDPNRSSTRVRWMTDALQALSRIDWPRNVASLEALVGQLMAKASTGYISVRDLPPEMVARASRRPLHRLEQLEANAILRAINDAGGNKHQAAEELGIARSTLYRKIRSLGIGLDVAAY